MITTLTLSKFKAFKDLKDIKLLPLTVILGKNSSGKSSVLHSLLLLKQTLDSGNRSSALSLDGKYLRFSNLSEVTHGLPAPQNAKLKYSIGVKTRSGDESVIEFSIKNEKDENSYHPVMDNVKTIHAGRTIDYKKLTIDRVRKLSEKREDDFLSKLLEKKEITGSIYYNNFLPEYYQINSVSSDNGDYPANLRLPMEFVVDEARIFSTIRQDIENIKYLSPVRATPQRAYIHYANDAFELNEDGSNSAHVLWGRRNQKVNWKGQEYKLTDAVNECIKCVGLAQEIEPSKTGKLIYQIKVKTTTKSKSVTISDVGFGYSQIIPVVLTGLLNSSKNMMLIEQPEIHLHPSSCANLADLFLGFVNDGKRFLVETHSQDFVNRLRLRVIENPALKDQINIVFVDSDSKGQSVARQFNIDEKGGFPEWPIGFLDESERAARLLIKARAEKLKKAEGKN